MSNNGQRVPQHPVSDVFPNRWSPRSFTGEPIADDELGRLFEAARWAPSSYNSQPWRFLYAKRDSSDFDRFLGLLYERNQSWAKNIGARDPGFENDGTPAGLRCGGPQPHPRVRCRRSVGLPSARGVIGRMVGARHWRL